jgi:hypothetical protein
VTRARLTTQREVEYDVVRFTAEGDYVLRDEHGDVCLFEESSLRERVEIRCDFCGRWVTHAAPVSAGSWSSWMCHGGTSACDETASAR